MVVTLSHSGYIKASPGRIPRQSAAGAASRPRRPKEDDWIDQLFIANTHDYILCFSNRGRLYWLKVWEVPARLARLTRPPHRQHVPAAGRREDQRGAAADRHPQLPGRPLCVHGDQHGHGQEDGAGRVLQPRKGGIIAVNLDEGDYLIGARLTDGKHDVMLFSDGGKAVRFDENDVRRWAATPAACAA